MKTSNKLLLGFLIVVFLVPLFTSFALRSVVKQGKYTIGLYPSEESFQQGAIGKYKAVKIINHPFPGGNDFICTIHPSPSGKYLFYDYSYDQSLFDSIGVEIKNDTLYIQRFTIHSPGMQATHNVADAWANRNIDLFLPSLDNITAERTEVKIDSSTNTPINIHLIDNSLLKLGNINQEVKVVDSKPIQNDFDNPKVKSSFKNITVNAMQSSVIFGTNVSTDSLWLYADSKSKISFLDSSNVRVLNGSIDKQSINNPDSATIKRLMPLVK
ncbi:hypothetical protein A9P82_07530 [Arachidicoccus ginsenosidimutans]|uniref:hypothetical protein n=1 Tax=Arachidicoccus sp. BS20 TaxID=1850526 RepID=UPI0007F14656|nr:hypothetical protein [Arachidicoccus sp. BS20]ANI89153.1 hypothetical protein A9P82_07530 [Arachidicoccus sp. BS20]